MKLENHQCAKIPAKYANLLTIFVYATDVMYAQPAPEGNNRS
jgi:hypothetical protein